MVEKMYKGALSLLEHIKHVLALLTSLSLLTAGVWSLFSISIDTLDAKVTAVNLSNKILVELITYTVPPTSATIYYRIDNKEILHHHYKKLPDGKKVQVVPLPLEYHSEVRVDVIIRIEGMRTLFRDNEVKFTQYVVTGE